MDDDIKSEESSVGEGSFISKRMLDEVAAGLEVAAFANGSLRTARIWGSIVNQLLCVPVLLNLVAECRIRGILQLVGHGRFTARES